MEFRLNCCALPRGIARILFPAYPHFNPPYPEFQKQVEVKGRGMRLKLAHLKNYLIISP